MVHKEFRLDIGVSEMKLLNTHLRRTVYKGNGVFNGVDS